MQRTDIQKLIAEYNNNKGWGRVIRNHPAIRALASLANKSKSDAIDDYAVVECFLKNPASPNSASHAIFIKILEQITTVPSKEDVAKALANLYSKANRKQRVLNHYMFSGIKAHPKLLDIAWAINILRLAKFGITIEWVDSNGIHHSTGRFLNWEPITKHENPRAVAEAFYYLNSKGLLHPEKHNHLELIASCNNPQALARHIEILSKATLPADCSIENIKQALVGLVNSKLVSSEHCNALLQHTKPEMVANIITELAKADILNQARFVLVLRHHKPEELNSAVGSLSYYKILNPETFLACAKHEAPSRLGSALGKLKKAKLLAANTAKTLEANTKPYQLADIFITLNKMKMLSPENIDACAATVETHQFTNDLDALINAGCFNHDIATNLKQDMLDVLIGCYQLTGNDGKTHAFIANNSPMGAIGKAIAVLFRAGIYTKTNFSAIMKHVSAPPESQDNYRLMFINGALEKLVEKQLLCQANFDVLIECRLPTFMLPDLLILLNNANLLNKKTQASIKESKRQFLPNIEFLQKLLAANILDEKIFVTLMAHTDPRNQISETFEKLSKDGLLTRDNFAATLSHRYPARVASALKILAKVSSELNIIIEPRYRDACVAHAYPESLARDLAAAIKLLSPHHVRVSEYLDSLSLFAQNHPNTDLAITMESLHRHGLFDDPLNLAACVTNRTPRVVAYIMRQLHGAGIELTPANRAAAAAGITDNEASLLYETLHTLKETELLNQASFDFVTRHPNLRAVCNILQQLGRNNILNEVNFTALTNPENQWLFSENAQQIIWIDFRFRGLTQERFDAILQIIANADADNVARQVLAYVNQIPEIQRANAVRRADAAALRQGPVFNDGQSTHTASVHKTVSESATRLMDRYKDQLEENPGLEDIIKDLKTWVTQLPDNFMDTDEKAESTADAINKVDAADEKVESHDDAINIVKAAKGCIQRITAVDISFTDPGSRVSLLQLLALAFTAINDGDKRQGELIDAQKQLIEGLYEIQRGYNLSEEGDDLGGRDQNICYGGTFNKIMEKLASIHPDVEVLYITKTQASCKLQIVVCDKAMEHLASLEIPNTAKAVPAFTELLNDLDKNGVDKIWNDIKDAVTDTMFDEFKSLYDNRRDHREFIGLIDAGQYTMLGDLSEFRKKNVKADSGVASNGMFATQPNGRQGNTDSEERKVDDKVAPGAGL